MGRSRLGRGGCEGAIGRRWAAALVAMALGVAAGCGGGSPSEPGAGAPPPGGQAAAGDVSGGGGGGSRGEVSGLGISLPAAYAVQIQGQADFTGVPGQRWVQPATVVIVPAIDRNPTSNNGLNAVDVGIFTQASPILGAAGALYFGTNTSLSSLVGSNLAASGVDIAFVGIGPGPGQIQVRVDGNVFGLPRARIGTFNIYNLTGGVTAQVHNVLAGDVLLQLAEGGQAISGTIRLGGSSGFGGPAVSSAYLGQFAGTRVE